MDTSLSRRRLLGAAATVAAAGLVAPHRATAATEPTEILLFGGQSNAGPSPAGGISPPLLGAEYPATALTFAGTNGYAPGRTQLSPAALTALAPQDDRPWRAQLAATATSFALENEHVANGTTSPGYFAFSAAEGGVPLEYLTRGAEATGHFSFVNTLAAADRVGPVLAAAGRTGVCHAYFFIHGENGPTAVSPPDFPTKRAIYRTMLGDYIDDVTAELRTRLGQPDLPEFVLLQTNGPDNQLLATYDPYLAGSVLGALDLARARLGQGVTLAGPAYHTQLADSVHTDNLGRLIVGELLAEVYRTIRSGATFQPLWPVSATLRGSDVLVKFALPGGRLQLDTDWVAPVPNYGFVYTDDAASATIASVRLASSDTICIRLTAAPTGANPVLRYALGNEQPLVQDHWSSARGQLYSDSGRPSRYAAAGFAIPPTIRHYAVRFDAPLSS